MYRNNSLKGQFHRVMTTIIVVLGKFKTAMLWLDVDVYNLYVGYEDDYDYYFSVDDKQNAKTKISHK